MTRLGKPAALLAFLPGSAIAHGIHAPVPEEIHAAVHAAPYAAALMALWVLGMALYARWRQ